MRTITCTIILLAILLAGCQSTSDVAKTPNRYVVLWAPPTESWRAIYETNAYTEKDGKVTFIVDKRVIGLNGMACDNVGSSVTLTFPYAIVDKRPTFAGDRPAEVSQ